MPAEKAVMRRRGPQKQDEEKMARVNHEGPHMMMALGWRGLNAPIVCEENGMDGKKKTANFTPIQRVSE